jgi:hypothetical protein
VDVDCAGSLQSAPIRSGEFRSDEVIPAQCFAGAHEFRAPLMPVALERQPIREITNT